MEFGLPNPVRKKAIEWISVRKILTSNDLSKLADEIANNTKEKFTDIHEKLQSLKKIEAYPLYEIIIDHDVEDVAEIFTRLNMAGVKIRESDVVIALVAAKQKGWVREEFNKFLKDLDDNGFEIDPAILIRSLAVIGKGIARLKEIPEDFWEKSKKFKDAWKETKDSIKNVVRKMNEIGILSSEILPSHNALIPMFVLYSKFKTDFNFNKALYWFLLATGDGRYSGSAITILDQDIKTINSSSSFDEAINFLIKPLNFPEKFTKNDFLNNYRNEFLRLILYLIIFENKAKDWINQNVKIGYDLSDNQLNEGFKPEWHHFFPRKYLKDHNIDENKLDLLANIVILNEKTNRIFKSKEPKEYINKHKIAPERLLEQFISDDKNLCEVNKYKEFLQKRASNLAKKANVFLAKLKNG